jgi:hypothetical protein
LWILISMICWVHPSTESASLNLEFFHAQNLELLDLDKPISESEIWKTIKDLPADQALGPDGYTGRFYKSLERQGTSGYIW